MLTPLVSGCVSSGDSLSASLSGCARASSSEPEASAAHAEPAYSRLSDD